MQRLFITCITVIVCIGVHAQKAILLRGKVIDKITNESLAGATIYISTNERGTTTNSAGEFELNVNESITRIKVVYLGYRDTMINITNNNASFLTIRLLPVYKNLSDIEITSSRENPKEKVNDIQMGMEKISMAEAKLLPAILGEV
ncbi:MAG: carboxypeptidase-like regulatory domain-containing protein, partial [Chitinophagaceae bacterium]|nr:carboxypeptidase-like regulatory domain-containing protein [Chitinophagaceae bacterium]